RLARQRIDVTAGDGERVDREDAVVSDGVGREHPPTLIEARVPDGDCEERGGLLRLEVDDPVAEGALEKLVRLPFVGLHHLTGLERGRYRRGDDLVLDPRLQREAEDEVSEEALAQREADTPHPSAERARTARLRLTARGQAEEASHDVAFVDDEQHGTIEEPE